MSTTQRPTPETDAFVRDYDFQPTPTDCLRLASRFEHERDEAREENEAMREAIKDIYYLTEGCADGAPDASAHDKLCNEIADKLKLFQP